MKANPKVVYDNQIKLLLERVINQPLKFSGCFEFVNKVLLYKASNDMKISLRNRI